MANWSAQLIVNQPKGRKPHKGTTMFEIETYKKPIDWAQVAMWIVSVTAIVVVALDLFVWRTSC
jgi:hypothetical protein